MKIEINELNERKEGRGEETTKESLTFLPLPLLCSIEELEVLNRLTLARPLVIREHVIVELFPPVHVHIHLLVIHGVVLCGLVSDTVGLCSCFIWGGKCSSLLDFDWKLFFDIGYVI